MVIFEGLQLETFMEVDIEIMSPIMKRAFDEDTRRFTKYPDNGPAESDEFGNGDFLRKWYINSGSHAYKISKDSKPIGAVNVFINDKNNENYLGNIFIDTDFQDKGIGTIIWNFIEMAYSRTVKWRTTTPAFSRRNHNFYINKCGFKVVKIDNPKKENGGQFVMEKTYQ